MSGKSLDSELAIRDELSSFVSEITKKINAPFDLFSQLSQTGSLKKLYMVLLRSALPVLCDYHYVKNIRIRSYSGPHSPAFGLHIFNL